MPELPEVETTRRGVEPHVVGREVERVVLRETRLRWPIPPDLPSRLQGQPLEAVERRAKYLLFRTPVGTVLVHLGMSGSLRLLWKSSVRTTRGRSMDLAATSTGAMPQKPLDAMRVGR